MTIENSVRSFKRSFDLEKAKWLDSMEGVPDLRIPCGSPGGQPIGPVQQRPLHRALAWLRTEAPGLTLAGLLVWLSLWIGTAQEKRMPILLEPLTIVLPVFVVIALGYLLRRVGLIDAAFLFQANRLIYYVALPLLLFYTIGTADFSSHFNGALVLGCGSAFGITFALSYAYASLRGYKPAVKGAFSQGAFRGNIAYVGLAIIFNAYGEMGLTRAGILMGFLVPLLNLFAVLALVLPQRQKDAKWGSMFLMRQIALNPLTIASTIGFLWSVLALPMPVVTQRSLKIATGMSLPLALIAIGGSFSFAKLKGDLARATFAASIKLVWLPLLAAVLLMLLGVRGIDLGVGVLIAGTPAATANYIMAHEMKGDPELAGSIVMISTALSAATFTIVLLLLKSLGQS
jgi:predicted permease